jgi:cellobiose phosphorylase
VAAGLKTFKRIITKRVNSTKVMEDYRKVKINKKYRRTKWDGSWIPSLKMEGDYLEKAGFTIDTNCSVKVENGRITILAL